MDPEWSITPVQKRSVATPLIFVVIQVVAGKRYDKDLLSTVHEIVCAYHNRFVYEIKILLNKAGKIAGFKIKNDIDVQFVLGEEIVISEVCHNSTLSIAFQTVFEYCSARMESNL